MGVDYLKELPELHSPYPSLCHLYLLLLMITTNILWSRLLTWHNQKHSIIKAYHTLRWIFQCGVFQNILEYMNSASVKEKEKYQWGKCWPNSFHPFIIGDSTPNRVSTLKHALGALDNERGITTKVNMSYSWLLLGCFPENIDICFC